LRHLQQQQSHSSDRGARKRAVHEELKLFEEPQVHNITHLSHLSHLSHT
jgi:hypothetical protein